MSSSLAIRHSKPLQALLAQHVKQAAQSYFAPLQQVIQAIQRRSGSTEDSENAKVESKPETVKIFESPAGARVLAGIAHELQNPLMAVLASAEQLIEDTGLSELQRRHVRMILDETDHTLRMVKDLSLLPATPRPAAVQVNSILRQLMELRAHHLDEHSIEIAQNLDEKLPEIRGDAGLLQQVFANILSLASDVTSTKSPARIEISTKKSGNSVLVSFRDFGISFPETARIFERFGAPKKEGIGLGLSVARAIVMKHAGELSYETDKERGSTITVKLPIAPEPESSAASS